MTCDRHGLTAHAYERANRHWRCLKCRQMHFSRRRTRAKGTLKSLLGGKCFLCGYSRCLWALDFHHVNPGEKSFELSGAIYKRAWAEVVAEARKCVLLCKNCHTEVEHGMTVLPEGTVEPCVTS